MITTGCALYIGIQMNIHLETAQAAGFVIARDMVSVDPALPAIQLTIVCGGKGT